MVKKTFTECDSVKKKRGRPKGSKNKVKTDIPKRRGRPPKKVFTECDGDVQPKRRGRPPKKTFIPEVTEPSNVRVLKFLGWCSNTECTCEITDADFIEGKVTMVKCIRCGTECRVTQLRKEDPTKGLERQLSKRIFLNDEDSYQNHDHVVPIPQEFSQLTTDEWDV